MKAIFALVFISLSLANAFFITPVPQAQLDTIQNSAAGLGDDDYDESFDELQATKSFLSGVLEGVNAGSLTDSTTCLTGTGPSILYQYYYGLILAAGTSGQVTAVKTTRRYLVTIGARLLNSLPSDFTQCLNNSNDFKNLAKKLRVDPTSDAFLNSFSQGAKQNPEIFSLVFSSAYEMFSLGLPEEAGKIFGAYLNTAAVGLGGHQQN